MDSLVHADSDVNLTCKKIISDIKSSRRNANRLIDLEELLLSDNQETVICALHASEEVFLRYISVKEMHFDARITNDLFKEKYQMWLWEQYECLKSHLLEFLVSGNDAISAESLSVIMKLFQAQSLSDLKMDDSQKGSVPKALLEDIIKHIIDAKSKLLITKYEEYLQYDDMKLYTLESILNMLNNQNKEETLNSLSSIFSILIKIQYPKKLPNDDTSENVFAHKSTEGSTKYHLKKKVFRKIFSSVWLLFLKCKFSNSLFRKVLIFVPKRVLPHLANPLLLTDFFTDSYNIGGEVSVLSLNGIFYLMQNCNLEYPDFYTKLYALFDAQILNSRHCGNFLYLSDIFLLSTHLPAYLVAAFIKRLSRLTLYVSPHILLLILPFIGNLLIRHPRLKIMIHNPDKPAVSEDPYDFEEADPMKCNALESSLWEVKALQQHWHPDVSTKANLINAELPQMEWDLANLLDIDFKEMIAKDLKNVTEVATSYNVPIGLFQREEDTMHQFWMT